MSRWGDIFKGQVEIARKRLSKAISAAKLREEANASAFAELARLTKVYAYVEDGLSSVDPEMVPLSVWDPVRSHLDSCAVHVESYASDGDQNNLHHANNYIDVVLASLTPYFAPKGKVGATVQKAALEYSRLLEDATGKAVEKAQAAINEIASLNSNASSDTAEIGELVLEVESLHGKLVGDGGIADEVKQKSGEIASYYVELISGSEDSPSIKDLIEKAKNDAVTNRDLVTSLLGRLEIVRADMEKFYSKVFGSIVESGEGRIGGYSHEFEVRLDEIKSFEAAQKTKYTALNEQIESLLPGATSAGLASAYKEMKESFDGPIKNASRVFYVSIGLLIVVSFALSIEKIGFWFVIFTQVGDWKAVIQALVHKVPYYAPVLWLALFASKRRSEYQRLQQEYAHKEALAKSYDSYKKQIAELDADDTEMLKALIQKAVEAVAHNASGTLDGKHGDEMPLQKTMDKLVEVLSGAMKVGA